VNTLLKLKQTIVDWYDTTNIILGHVSLVSFVATT
jgi:hypothetical protein